MQDQPNRMRVSDQERESVVEQLRAAAKQGLLDHQELEQRIAQALKSTYQDQLACALEQLPKAAKSTELTTVDNKTPVVHRPLGRVLRTIGEATALGTGFVAFALVAFPMANTALQEVVGGAAQLIVDNGAEQNLKQVYQESQQALTANSHLTSHQLAQAIHQGQPQLEVGTIAPENLGEGVAGIDYSNGRYTFSYRAGSNVKTIVATASQIIAQDTPTIVERHIP